MQNAEHSAALPAPDPSVHGFASTLRAWRLTRGMSQFDLAERVGLSTRHLSFLETGKARPSREMAIALAEGLMCPRAARNQLLLEAGYAPLYPTTPLTDEALSPFRAILAEMMARHAPFPAMVCDRHWTIQDANPSAWALLGPLQGSSKDRNVIRLLAQSPAAPQVIINYIDVLQEMTGRLHLEALEAGHDPVLTALLALLAQRLSECGETTLSRRRPVAPVEVATANGPWRFLTTVAHFGTSEDVTVRDLRLELLFPADAATRNALLAAFGG
jgi:transcriptional regulator with XRE-family HTH domain